MSREEEIEKIKEILDEEHYHLINQRLAEVLVDNGIRSKKGFYVPEDGYYNESITPIEYEEENNGDNN